MAAKFFVWGEGVWREVDVASGRVSGWRRRARFVYVRRGRLLVARRRPVLQALRALAAGEPSAAADGLRLSQRSKSAVSHRKHRPPAAPGTCEHHHCCANYNGYNNNGKVAHPPPAPAAPPAPPARVREAGTQCGTELARAYTINVKHKPVAPAAPTAPTAPAAPVSLNASSGDEFLSALRKPLATRSTTSEVNALLGRPAPAAATAPPAATADSKRSPVKTSANDSDDDDQKGIKVSEKGGPAPASEPGSVELIISEAHVAALRGFVARTQASALARFDADDDYKRALFYAINPLVELQRCARLERLLRERRAAALPHFAARLGLTPRSSASAPPSPAPARALRPRAKDPSAEPDTDKENKEKHTSPIKVRTEPPSASKSAADKRTAVSEPALTARLGVTERINKERKELEAIKAPQMNGIASNTTRAKRRAPAPPKKKALIVSGDGDRPAAGAVGPPAAGAAGPPPAGTHVISKRASAAGAKEYSNLEDHAIVAWLSVGARASLVNGNRVWRELQPQYERLTGAARSWHSLRNRYLRYILPALGALRLPPADVSRLRAAAATGAIKTKQRAAAGLAPGEPPASSPHRQSPHRQPPHRAAFRRARLTSEAEHVAPAVLNDTSHEASSPARQTRATRQSRPPASGSKNTSNKDDSSKESGSKPRSPRYSDVTRRFAARRRVLAPSSSSSRSPSPSPSPSPVLPPPATHSRKLFNPNSKV